MHTINENAGQHVISAGDIASEQKRVRSDHLSLIKPTFPNTNSTMWDSVCEMLELCRKNGWNAILVTPPYLAEYSDCYSDEFFTQFYSDIKVLTDRYSVPYWDYSHDSHFTGRYAYFKNIDHLNIAGAKEFDKIFLARLGNI